VSKTEGIAKPVVDSFLFFFSIHKILHLFCILHDFFVLLIFRFTPKFIIENYEKRRSDVTIQREKLHHVCVNYERKNIKKNCCFKRSWERDVH
jgi:hypothetical protein